MGTGVVVLDTMLSLAFLCWPVLSPNYFVAGHRGSHALVAVLALALGQTAGKLLLFDAARRGTGRLAQKPAHRIARRPGAPVGPGGSSAGSPDRCRRGARLSR
ncbi:hypothetical protein GCM10027186_53390 [Micromonospora schwarzwaldensis]